MSETQPEALSSTLPARMARSLEELRKERPLVHNITNYVVMDFSANALLSIGAAPVMAHALEEVRDMVRLARALVLNIGTLSGPWIEAMLAAGVEATRLKLPVVLDPVGAGATPLRTETARRLLYEVRPTIVRGNPSEILALGQSTGTTRGVDSTRSVDEARGLAVELARQHQVVVAVTGPEDFVTDGQRQGRVANGHPLMGRVTGTGCVASALIAAFAAVESDPLVAAVTGLGVFGVAAELAALEAARPGSFRTRLVDALDAVGPEELVSRARVTLE